MGDNNLINIDGLGDVLVKFLDMLEKACVWAVSPHGSKKEFESGLQAYTRAVSEDDSLSPFEKGARIASARKDLKEYINKGNIINYALQDIKSDAKNNVDEDWLNYFFEYAKNISDDLVQRIWARILAEQTNGDTSIQRQLIHVLSLLDYNSAIAFTNLCKITIRFPQQKIYETLNNRFESQYVPLVLNYKLRSLDLVYSENSPEYIRAKEYIDCIPSNEQMSVLEEIGLIQFPEDMNKNYSYPYNIGLVKHDFSGPGNTYVKTEVKDYIIEYNGKKYKVLPKEGIVIDSNDPQEVHLPESINVGFVKFTTIGEELFRLISIEALEHFDEYIRVYFKRIGFSVECFSPEDNN